MFNVTYNKTTVPISESVRSVTDICCTIVGAIFAIAMLAIAFSVWNKAEFNRKFSFEHLGANDQFCPSDQFVKLNSPQNFADRTCVSSCGVDMSAVQSNLCMPISEKDRAVYLQNPLTSSIWDQYGYLRALFYTALFAIGLGLLWLIVTQAVGRSTTKVAIVLACLTMLTTGILLLLLANWSSWHACFKLGLAIICFILLVIIAFMGRFYQTEVKFQSIFIDYATRFITENNMQFLWIPVFMFLSMGLLALIGWQHCCYLSKWAPVDSSVFDMSAGGFMGWLNLIELLWGITFLRDAFIFLTGGVAEEWYFSKSFNSPKPLKRLFKYNWGSVVAGSFCNTFFEIPTLIIELFSCHSGTCCDSAGKFCDKWPQVNELVRTDAYSFINLTGVPYCNAARQCGLNCEKSKYFIGSHSSIKHIRFIIYVGLIGLISIVGYLFMHRWCYNFNCWNLLIGLIIAYLMVTWFVEFHCSPAESLQTCYLFNRRLQQFPHETIIHQEYKNELSSLEVSTKAKTDGFCV